jgi:putative ABC transport system permease protein
MFDLDKWQEIYHTIKQNKLRTFLTGFSVAWGIFMLLILLGSGKGLENGFTSQFQKESSNGIWIYSGQTSLPYKSTQPGKYIKFSNDDYQYLKNSLEDVDNMSAEIYVFGWGGSAVTYKNKTGAYTIRGIFPDHKNIEFKELTSGRFINEKDIQEFRKVVAVGDAIVTEIFENEDPIGKYININKIPFKIVGVFKEELGQNQRGKIYVPISTGQKAFGMGNDINEILMTTTVGSVEESIKLTQQIRRKLAHKHQFDPQDPRAIYIDNNLEDFKLFSDIFGGIRTFIWIIGIGTIVAGMIGIGNIMTVVVKERTKEIGIRKALGATPVSILSLIIQESTLITTVFGYIGLVLGIGLTEMVSKFVPQNGMFYNPTVDLDIALLCTGILIVSGVLAGFFPALKASNVKPIEAMSDK